VALGQLADTAYRSGQDFLLKKEASMPKLVENKGDLTHYIPNVQAEIDWRDALLRTNNDRYSPNDGHSWGGDAIKVNLLKGTSSHQRNHTL